MEKDLVHLVYVSKANFKTRTTDEIVPEVSSILPESRRNNRARGIVGALYYGNGYSFRCWKGRRRP